MDPRKNRNRLAVVIEGGEDEEEESILRRPRRNRNPGADHTDIDEVDGFQGQLRGFRLKVRQSVQAILPEFAKSQQHPADPTIGEEEEEQLLEDAGASVPFLNYLTLKVLFWDIGITLGDTVTDLWQGVALVLTPGKYNFLRYCCTEGRSHFLLSAIPDRTFIDLTASKFDHRRF